MEMVSSNWFARKMIHLESIEISVKPFNWEFAAIRRADAVRRSEAASIVEFRRRNFNQRQNGFTLAKSA
jgi:hypothetical protein